MSEIVSLDFEIHDGEVSLIRPDGLVVPLFSAEYISGQPGQSKTESLGTAVVTLMQDLEPDNGVL